jgi:hypothetical protein
MEEKETRKDIAYRKLNPDKKNKNPNACLIICKFLGESEAVCPGSINNLRTYYLYYWRRQE